MRAGVWQLRISDINPVDVPNMNVIVNAAMTEIKN
jgi:hypothetical protein